jgi:alpha 1,3-mannosyltransferase
MSAVNEPKSSSALSTYSCYRLRYLYRRRRILIICFVATIVMYVIFAHPARQTTQASDDGYMGGCYRIEMGACLNEDRLQDTESQQPAFQNDDILSNTVQKVLKTILPGEMEAHKLLETIHGSGKERLHELGLRTRAFKQLFDVWEALHLVSVENSLYIRDDVIQRLQGRESRLHSSQSTLAETVRCYEAFRSLVQNLGRLLFPWSAPYFADHMILHTQFYRPGRGIVLTAGNDQIIYLITSVKLIRKLGCRLPIEIMYLGEGDLNKDNRRRLERLPGVITRDIRRMVDDKGWQLRGWAGKPYAILLSSFREVIFIDADALFFQNPEVLFEDNSYIETGALFFHDRLMMKESKKSWLQETLPKPISAKAKQSRLWTGQSAHMQESGVVVVDKWKHFISLLLVMRMNGPDRDGNEGKGIVGVYDMLYGEWQYATFTGSPS